MRGEAVAAEAAAGGGTRRGNKSKAPSPPKSDIEGARQQQPLVPVEEFRAVIASLTEEIANLKEAFDRSSDSNEVGRIDVY